MNFKTKLQQGFSLLTAIFLLVVLGGLGTMMVTFFVAQQQSSALDVMGSRAYQAARAGIQWAAYNIATQTQTDTGVTLWTGCRDYATSTPLFEAGQVTALEGTLSPFKVELKCEHKSYDDGGTIWVYNITASAVSGGKPGSPDYVERVISAKMGR